jgi:hypothetical protein
MQFFADAFAEMTREVSEAYSETTEVVSSAVDSTAQAVSGGASSLMQAGRDALAKGFAFFRRTSEAPRAHAMLREQRLAGPHAIPRIGLRSDLN